MLHEGRLPLTAEENAACERLLAKHGPGSLTRRDPGEAGPLHVEISGCVWSIDERGRTRKLRKAS